MTTDVPELLVVTGMSGAGKTAVTASLDDLGWFVVDNLPALVMQLVDTVTERTESTPHSGGRRCARWRVLPGAARAHSTSWRPAASARTCCSSRRATRPSSDGSSPRADRIRCRAKGVCSTRSAGA